MYRQHCLYSVKTSVILVGVFKSECVNFIAIICNQVLILEMSVLELTEQYVQLLEVKLFLMNGVLAVYSTRFLFTWFHLRYARIAFLLNALVGVIGLLYFQLEPLVDLGSVKVTKGMLEKFGRLLFLPLMTLQLYALHGYHDLLTVSVVLGPPCAYLVAAHTLSRHFLSCLMVYNSWLFLISVDSSLACNCLGLASMLVYFVLPANGLLHLLATVSAVVAANSCLHNVPTKQAFKQHLQ